MPVETRITETLNSGGSPLEILKAFLPNTDYRAGGDFVVVAIIIVAVISIISTLIIFYHWKRYAVKIGESLIPKIIYLAISGVLWLGFISYGIKLVG